MSWVVVGALAGCRALLGIDDPIAIDAATGDAAVDATGSGSACLGNPASLQVCIATPQVDRTFNTALFTEAPNGTPDNCDFLQPYASGSGLELCVIAGKTITIANVTVDDELGKRPIVFVATDAIVVQQSLDGNLHHLNNNGLVGPGALTGTCPVLDGSPGSDGGGGGAGGSFGTAGRSRRQRRLRLGRLCRSLQLAATTDRCRVLRW